MGVSRRQRFEVAEVLADHHAAGAGQRYRRLEVRAEGKNVRRDIGDRDRAGRIAARPAQHQLAAANHPHDGIVERPDDRPVVDEKEIGDVAEPRHRLALLRDDRLVAEIAARRDDGKAEFA